MTGSAEKGSWAAFTIAAILSAAVSILQFHGSYGVVASGQPLFTDFEAIREGARITIEGHGSDAYNHGPIYYTYPPTLALLLYPFTLMTPLTAHLAWLVFSAATAALAITLLWTRARAEANGPVSSSDLAMVAIAFAVGYPLASNVASGQNGIFCASLLTIGLLAVRDRPWLSGLCLGLLTFKPHYGLLIPIALVAGRCWTSLVATSVATIGLATVSAMLFGYDAWFGFAAGLMGTEHRMDAGGFTNMRMATLFTAVYDLAGRTREARPVAFVIQACFAILAACVTARAWRTGPGSLKAISISVAAIPLSTPYLFDYDLTLYAVPLLIWVALAEQQRRVTIRYVLAAFLIAGPWGLISSILTDDRFNVASILHPLAYCCVVLTIVLWSNSVIRPEPKIKPIPDRLYI